MKYFLKRGGSSGASRGGGGGAAPTAPSPFSATDNGPFRQMTSQEEQQYYARQNLNQQQVQAFDNYTEPNPEPGSLYNFSQNMNYNYANGLPMTQKQQDTFNTIVGSMHNLGYNAELTRYDHASSIDEMLAQAGVNIRGGAANATPSQLKKHLLNRSYTDPRILSTSANDFKNTFDPSTFNTRQYKITYRAKASTQAVMPGRGKVPLYGSGQTQGDDFMEMLLSPSNTYKIVDVKYSGAKARAKGQPRWNLTKKQIELVVEVG